VDRQTKTRVGLAVDKEPMKEFIKNLGKEELIELFIRTLRDEPEEVRIPISIFKAKLSSLELIVKYMRENLGYSNKKTALILKRTAQNTWITYRNAKQKHPDKLIIVESEYDIPLSIFEDTELSVLESIVLHLRKTLSDKQVAKMLYRSSKTITTVYNRAINKKQGEK